MGDIDTGYQEVKPTGNTKKDIDIFAEYFCEKMKFFPGDNIEELVEKMGGVIEYQDMDQWMGTKDGSIIVKGRRDFTIYVSNFTGPLRNRFTIAHELAHYVLHSNCGSKKIQAARRGSNPAEWEANWFAAGILMPKKAFKAQQEISDDNGFLASHFMVSPDAIAIRKMNI